MKSRTELPDRLTTLGLTGTMVEVGTYKGEFAQHLLDHWPGTLICVDAWLHFPEANDLLNHPQEKMEACYQETLQRLQPYEHRCAVFRMLSVDAAAKFAGLGEQFDVVYLDASHDFVSVTQDIAMWWPLVRPGGLLMGHDYLNGTREEGFPADFGVKAAVDGWAGRYRHPVCTTTDDPFPTWWVDKP